MKILTLALLALATLVISPGFADILRNLPDNNDDFQV